MQKRGLQEFSVIWLFVFNLFLMSTVYSIEPYEVLLCRKTVIVKAEEIALINFYMPAGKDEFGAKYDFKVYKSTIRYHTLDPIGFAGNIRAIIEFMERGGPERWNTFMEPENGAWGYYCFIRYDGTGKVYYYTQKYVNKTWNIFLFNEDSYEKEVEVTISKVWHLL